MGVGAEKRQCLSPAPFSAHRKFAQIGPKPAQNPSLGQGCYPSPKEATQRLTGRNRGLPSLGHSTVLCCQRNPFCSATLLYTYISRFSVPLTISNSSISDLLSLRFSTSRTNGPRLLSRVKVGTHLGSLRKIAHNGSHGETRVFRTGVVSLPSERSARSQISPGRVSERQTLPLLGLGRVYARRTQKAFGTAMRSCVSLFRGVAAPLGCVIFFAFVEIAACTPCVQCFPHVWGRGGITTLSALHVLLKRRTVACQKGSFAAF